jgi:alkylated DNA nucleotide flippase Atl1
MVSKKKQDLVETALEQLIVAGFQSRGMEPQEAQLAGRATMIGLGVVDKAVGAGKRSQRAVGRTVKKTTKRQLNDWQRYVKANSSKHKYKSGKKKGQINLKAVSRAFKKTKKGRKR